MKKLILLTVVSILFRFDIQCQESYKISPENSTIEWIGEKVSGAHSGYINLQNAFFLFKEEKFVGGEFNIDMNSIKCTDIENAKYAAKLEEHLKDSDFFNCSKYPTSNFKITNIIFDGTSYMITGDITIKEITQEIKFPAQFENDGDLFHANATLKIDRTKHDIKYGSGSFFDDLGNRMIYDEFTLKIHLQGSKAQD
ncbi:MAG: lipid-binding protein [Bacteroidetes bacterium MED-G21]|nr:MAG: lipid-binding protein [Bacteroidetes bacterium MED-G21]